MTHIARPNAGAAVALQLSLIAIAGNEAEALAGRPTCKIMQQARLCNHPAASTAVRRAQLLSLYIYVAIVESRTIASKIPDATLAHPMPHYAAMNDNAIPLCLPRKMAAGKNIASR